MTFLWLATMWVVKAFEKVPEEEDAVSYICSVP